MGLFKKASELKEKQTISALIYGQPGAGKSTIAVSAPSPVAVFDFDGGIQRVNVAHLSEAEILQVTKWEEVGEALASEEINSINTIVIDTAGKMLSYMDKYIIATSRDRRPTRSLTLNEYGTRKVMFNNFVQQVITMGKNLIFVAHDREEKDGEVKKIRPEIGGSSSGDLIKELDLVGYLEIIGNDRIISFTPSERYYAKNACSLPPRMSVPVVLDDKGEMIKVNGRVKRNTFMTDIIKMYTSSQSERNQKLAQYETLKEILADKVRTVADAASANSIYKEISAMEVIFDSELYGKQLLHEKTISLGLKWDKMKKEYV